MNIKKTFAYRGVWMGIAMLWVMLFHSSMELVKGISTIKSIGYGGVDIFIFASGVGNYYSYLKNEKPLSFLNRKIKRLAPTYIPFIIFWCIYNVVQGKLEYIYIPGNILGIQGFSASGISFNWYLTGIAICYLLTPYLATKIHENSFLKNIILVLVLIIISISFWGDSKFIVSVTRLPIYVVGMIFAKNENVWIRKIIVPIVGMFILGAVFLGVSFKYASGQLWKYGLYWYPFLFITPFVCVAISEISFILDKNGIKWPIKLGEFIGSISFEIYLIHLFAFNLIKSKMELNNIEWILAGVVVCICSFAYSKLIKIFTTDGRIKR